ncbi:putative rhamnogalacturonate lyase C [Colletotrichum sp. SAR 10_96]|nr:putative rhamnogalacturonate lyase C [Colletotrichum sp. SAR 10_96]
MDGSTPIPEIKTRILIISDTHGASSLPGPQPLPSVDVAIHCGDLTEESKLVEFQKTINLMKSINAPLKIVIAGNHDWTLDTPIFKSKIAEIPPPVDMALVHAEYGTFNQARDLLLSSSATDITFLQHQGTHRLTLPNGARLTLYASPFTPSTEDWAFQYDPARRRRANGMFDGADVIAEKRRKMEEGLRRGYFTTSHCADDERPLVPGEDTLFVNAAIKGDGEHPQHLPWIVDIELPKAS